MGMPILPLIPNIPGFVVSAPQSSSLHLEDSEGNRPSKPRQILQGVPKVFKQFNRSLGQKSDAAKLDSLETRESKWTFGRLFERETASSSGQDEEVDQTQLSKVYPPWVKRTVTEADCHCDAPVINCLSSLPFFIFTRSIRDMEKHGLKPFANSMYGVGLTATAYHAARGPSRTHFRWLDYVAIALATTALNTAAFPQRPKGLTAAAVALTPFHPFKVVAGNLALLEGKMVCSGARHKEMRKAVLGHQATVAVAASLFVREEGWAHALWHLASLATIQTILPVVKDLRHQALEPCPV